MKTQVMRCWLTVVVIAAATATAQRGDHTYTSAALQTGARVYFEQCAVCHGPDGAWIAGVNLARGVFRTAVTDDDLRQVITNGAAEGRMPAIQLSETRLDGIIAYMRTGFDPDGDAVRIGDPANGRKLFGGKGECSQCHRVDGIGPRMAPDLSDVGVRRTPAALQRTLVEPATALFPIDRKVTLLTRDEETIVGRRLNEDTFSVQLIDSNERLRSVLKADLVTYEISAEPTHEATTLSTDEVADLVAYMLTLKR